MRSGLSAFPSSLFARMALILLAGLLTAQGISLWLQWGERATVVSQARGLHFADRIADAVRSLEARPAAQRQAAIASIQSNDLHIDAIDASQAMPFTPRGQIQSSIAARLGGEREIRSPGGMGGMGNMAGMPQHDSPTRTFDIRLKDGQWVRITAAREASAPALPNDLIAHLLVTLLIVVTVVMLAVREATKPLQKLAQAADTLGIDLDAPPLAETGPTETRRAAQAFNHMQERIRRLLGERSRALAAVSHDLRTPLTRLRLRTELVEDPKLRSQMEADLEAMAAMLDATLDYLRDIGDKEPPCLIDINALVHSLIDDASILGQEIQLEGEARTPYSGHLTGLRRALQNLIDNAFKYGRSARIRIEDSSYVLRLAVEDEGPGIPEAELARVTEPYYRPDTARRAETGGLGLGLSIVKGIAQLHGGELLLINQPLGGFSATLILPRLSLCSDKSSSVGTMPFRTSPGWH